MDNCPPDDDNLRSALCKNPGCVDFGGAGVYGRSPATFAPWGNTAFLGGFELGELGTSWVGESGVGRLPEAEPKLWDVGENFEEMLDNHEFLLDVGPPGDGDLASPLIVIVFSEEPDLEIAGRGGMVCGEVGLSLICDSGISGFEIGTS